MNSRSESDPALRALDDAWETLAADIHAHGYSVRDAIAVHRSAIEAAVLAAAEAAPLDVERLTEALNRIHSWPASAERSEARAIAAEYAALRPDTEETT